MSHESIADLDDLYARWQRNPEAKATTELCEALRDGRRPDLVEIVGSHAARQLELPPLLAAARMYTGAGRLDDAQSVLLTAGRLAPRDGEVYRWLGEVLLRRGDAERAEKVLEKALQFGANHGAPLLLDRARELVSIQRSSGTAAVADAVARSDGSFRSATALAAPLGGPPKLRPEPPRSEEDVDTAVRNNADVRSVIEAALAPLSRPPPAAGEPARGRPAGAPPNDLFFTTPARAIGFDLQPKAETRNDELESLLAPDAILSDPGPFHRGGRSGPPAAASTAAFGFDGVVAPPPSRSSDRTRPAPPKAPPPLAPLAPLARDALGHGSSPTLGSHVPEARDVLDALQIAGVYEPEASIAPQPFVWSKPTKVRRLFSTISLGVLALLLVGGGIGTYQYVTARRGREHVEAERVLAQVDQDLHASEAARLAAAEKTIANAFELDSRSPHAALTWLHERALVGLLKGGADVAFEDGIQRAKAVGVDEKKFAFAHVASFLFQGDTAGAAATVAKWDAIGQGDAWFQLLAGATFERAGDTRSLERYAAAVKLDPELIAAQTLLTRATAVDGDPRRAAELAKEFRVRYPARAEGAALVALAWTRDTRSGEEPAELKDVVEKSDLLPISLRAVPHAARAVLALHRGAVDEARPSVQKGLELADTPGIAAWLGSIALTMGDENLARKAALTAVSFSAVYPPARVLAARVALLGARLDEALKAAEDLPPTSPDVAIVTAAVAYERLDGERLARSFDALPESAKNVPFAAPLVRGQALLAGNLGVLTGDKARAMADDEDPWADIVAMDWALDAGELATAKKIAEQWHGEPRAMRALRLARLARYDGKLDEADRYSRVALDSGTVTMRVLVERVFTLVAMKRDTDALALFKAYPNVGGPLAKWLRAYATAAHGKIDEARAIVAQEDPPPPAAAMPARIIAASAYAMMKDTRHGADYTKPIVQAGFANPDVVFAAEKLGGGKAVRRVK